MEIESGLAQFGLGALKKLVIADQVAGHVDLIFATPGQYDALTLLQGALGYTVQIYCDFSGYSDMAIGAARIMGYRTAENFQMPYSATNITDFWHRWHISLSSWFRDYLFLPLAYAFSRRMPEERYLGVRVDLVIYVVAILTTFAVCGLWHGASWTFVALGLPPWHGARRPPRVEALAAVQRARGRNSAFRRVGHASPGWRRSASSWRAGFSSVPSPCRAAWRVPRAHRHLGVRRHAAAVALHPPGLPCVLARPSADEQGQELAVGDCAAACARCESCPMRSLVFLIVSFGATDAAPFIYSQF